MLEKINETIDRWFQEQIGCAAIARHTEAYNQAFAAKADLKNRMAALFPPAQPAVEAASEEGA